MSRNNSITKQSSNGNAKLPAFHFYIGDWKKDAAVQALSVTDRGVWLECLFLMHDSSERGVLLLNGTPPTIDELARLIGTDKETLTHALTALKNKKICDVREDGALVSRRMVADEANRTQCVKNGLKGGNPKLLNPTLNPPLNPHANQNPEDESESEYEDLNLKKNSQPPGPPLEQRGKHIRMSPDDWQKLQNEFGNTLKIELPEADRWIEDNKTCDKNARKYARPAHNHYLFFRGWLRRNLESGPKVAHLNGHQAAPRPQPPPFKPPKPTPPPTPEQRANVKKLIGDFFEGKT